MKFSSVTSKNFKYFASPLMGLLKVDVLFKHSFPCWLFYFLVNSNCHTTCKLKVREKLLFALWDSLYALGLYNVKISKV